MTKICATRVAFAVAVSLAGADGQPGTPVTFEVASVRAHKPALGPLRVSTTVETDGIRFINVTLRGCIRQAYWPKPYQISGGPAWLNDDRYDIIAKAAGPASKAQLMRMLQSLLAERFHLAVHRENKEMPVYALLIAKKGPKIHEVKDDGSGSQIDGDAAHALSARNISMTQFAAVLSRYRQLDRPVLDRTGLDGVFNITLDFAADDAAPTDSAAGPSVFTALQEQLGLRLEPAKGPVEIFVVDHAEKPSEN